MMQINQTWLVMCALVAFGVSAYGETQQKPNVVIIYSDDMGYVQLGITGATNYKTPAIDSIAQSGVWFPQGYVSGPVCAPSRAGLMTGRYQARFGYETFTGPIVEQKAKDIGVPTHEIFLPKKLKQLGYTTAHIGKWHLGHNDKHHPNRRGVDYFFGFLSGGHDYFEWDENKQQKVTNGGGPILKNDVPQQGEGYLTEELTKQTCDFIHENKDKPFYVMYAPFNVHTPIDVPEKYIPEGGTKLDGMVVALDIAVRDILKTLEETGLAENTIVFFINDNGGTRKHNNGRFKGSKGTLYEGGIRVPFMMKWPRMIDAGITYHPPVIQLDVMPTVLAAAGAREIPSNLDGVNLLPYLTGRKTDAPHDKLYWRFPTVRKNTQKLSLAMREGKWKLHQANRNGKYELYDLEADPGEKTNLSKQFPDRVEQMKKELLRWEQDVLSEAKRKDARSFVE